MKGEIVWPPFHFAVYDFDAESELRNLSRRAVLWRPVGDGRPASYLWPAHQINNQLWRHALHSLQVEFGYTIRPRSSVAGQHELQKLAAYMRDVASRWPFRSTVNDQLRTLADAIDDHFHWSRFFPRNKWPMTIGRQDQLRTSMNFWALREMRAAFITLGFNRETLSRSALKIGGIAGTGPAMTKSQRVKIDRALSNDSLDRRTRAFAKRLRPDVHADVMARILHGLVSANDLGRVEYVIPDAFS